MERQVDSQQQEIEVLLKVENPDAVNDSHFDDQINESMRLMNEKITSDDTSPWSIPEIAWFEAMVDCCNNGSVNLNSAESTLTQEGCATFKRNLKGSSDKKPSVPQCLGQGDGIDSPIYFRTPHTSVKGYSQGGEYRQQYSHAPITSLENEQHEESYRNVEQMSCIGFETPRLFYTPSTGQLFDSASLRQQSSRPKKLYGSQTSASRTYPCHPSENRDSPRPGTNCSECRTPTSLGPPHIARLKTCNSTSSSSGTGCSSSTDANISPTSSVYNSSTGGSNKSTMTSDSSPVYPKVPYNTPVSEERTNAPKKVSSTLPMFAGSHIQQQSRSSFHSQLSSKISMWRNFPGSDMRETHNAKERHRRSRIRDACNNLRNSVPTISERTDNATVFEVSYKYMLALREWSRGCYDEEFIQLLSEKKHG